MRSVLATALFVLALPVQSQLAFPDRFEMMVPDILIQEYLPVLIVQDRPALYAAFAASPAFTVCCHAGCFHGEMYF